MTADDDDASIDANVYVTVYGTRGNTDPLPLGINDGDLFQAGNTDEFEVTAHLSDVSFSWTKVHYETTDTSVSDFG